MPMYAYACAECGTNYERLRGINQTDKEVECPNCGNAGRAKRLMSSFASFTKVSGATLPGATSVGTSSGPAKTVAKGGCGPGCGCHGGI